VDTDKRGNGSVGTFLFMVKRAHCNRALCINTADRLDLQVANYPAHEG